MMLGQARAGGRWNDETNAMTDPPVGASGAGDAPSPLSRFKGSAPAAAAGFAIVASLVGASLLASRETSTVAPQPPPATSEDSGAAFPQTAPQAGGPGSSLPGAAFDQAPGAAPPAMAMEIVVKFKDDAKIKDIVDAFWRDQGSARSRFENFKAGKTEFSGLRLERVTYSNELVLVTESSSAGLPAMREVASRLASHPDVAYAEPNMTAQPGGR